MTTLTPRARGLHVVGSSEGATARAETALPARAAPGCRCDNRDVTEQLRLMAVHAHPDDESSKGAATMARYVSEGVDVLVVTLTDGSRGSILNPAMERPEILDNIGEVRRQEMERARE